MAAASTAVVQRFIDQPPSDLEGLRTPRYTPFAAALFARSDAAPDIHMAPGAHAADPSAVEDRICAGRPPDRIGHYEYRVPRPADG
jgi:hypothetical protein